MITDIKRCFREDRVLYSQHARLEMRTEPLGRILEQEVAEAISSAEVIEEYPEDQPYSSCLAFGRTRQGRPIHIVSAYAPQDNQVFIITVYEPDPERWIEYRRRREP